MRTSSLDRRIARWLPPLLMLALLSLAVAAGPARAEGLREYEPHQEFHVPEKTKPESGGTEPQKKTPGTTGPGAGPQPGGIEEPAEESSVPPVGSEGGSHPGSGESGPPAGAKPGDTRSAGRVGVGGAVAVAYPHHPEAATATLAGSSGGGSSPVVPILIAVAILAAISIGTVVYRHRRAEGGRPGSA
jgi:hypothetical protein